MAYTVTFCIPCIYPACSGAVSAGRRVILRPPSGPPPSRRRLYNRTPPRQFQTVPRNSCGRTCAQSRRRRQMSPPRAPRRRPTLRRVVPPDEISAYGRADYEQNYENDKCCFQSLFHADSSMTGYDNDIFCFTLRSEYSKIF